MKHLFKLLTVAALGASVVLSCGKKDEPVIPEKPVVKADMYSVTANAETGEVVFKFTAEGLSPFWTVIEPSGTKTTFTDREVTKTYKAKGLYKGNIIAYGDGGQSDPVDFEFTITGATTPVDPTMSETENILISETWKLLTYGYYGGEGEEYWDWYDATVPACAADDRFTFKKDGSFVMSLGENTGVYNDDVGIQDGITVSGNEKWAYVKEGDAEYIQFSDGGFPGMLGNDAAINGKYLISNLTAESFNLCYQQSEEQWFVVILVPDWYEPPHTGGEVTEESAKAALSGKTFQVSDFGWWGEGWQWFTVSDGGEDLPVNVTNDYVTFSADGSLVLALGIDDPVEEGGEAVVRVYNDGVENGEVYTATGNEKWSIVTQGEEVMVQFAGGGFPLMIAGLGTSEDSTYHFGMDARWTVASVGEDGTVRLEIYQDFNEQYFTVFLTPVE